MTITRHQDFGIRANQIDTVKPNKTQQIKAHLLSGKPITGLEMMLVYGCLTYRDVIYRLRNQGLNIQSKMTGNSTRYAIYWLDEAELTDKEA